MTEEAELMDTASKWERVSGDIEEAERIYRKSRTFLGDVWYRFRRKPTALCGFILVLLLLIFCLAGPAFTPYSYSEQNNKMASIPPVGAGGRARTVKRKRTRKKTLFHVPQSLP